MSENLTEKVNSNQNRIENINLIEFLTGIFKEKIPQYLQIIYYYQRALKAFLQTLQPSVNVFQLFTIFHHLPPTFTNSKNLYFTKKTFFYAYAKS